MKIRHIQLVSPVVESICLHAWFLLKITEIAQSMDSQLRNHWILHMMYLLVYKMHASNFLFKTAVNTFTNIRAPLMSYSSAWLQAGPLNLWKLKYLLLILRSSWVKNQRNSNSNSTNNLNVAPSNVSSTAVRTFNG